MSEKIMKKSEKSDFIGSEEFLVLHDPNDQDIPALITTPRNKMIKIDEVSIVYSENSKLKSISKNQEDKISELTQNNSEIEPEKNSVI